MATNNKNAKKSEMAKARRGMDRGQWAATKKLRQMTAKQAKNVRRGRAGQTPKPRKILSK